MQKSICPHTNGHLAMGMARDFPTSSQQSRETSRSAHDGAIETKSALSTHPRLCSADRHTSHLLRQNVLHRDEALHRPALEHLERALRSRCRLASLQEAFHLNVPGPCQVNLPASRLQRGLSPRPHDGSKHLRANNGSMPCGRRDYLSLNHDYLWHACRAFNGATNGPCYLRLATLRSRLARRERLLQYRSEFTVWR